MEYVVVKESGAAKFTEADLPSLNSLAALETGWPFSKIMSDGRWAYIQKLAFTWGLCLGGDDSNSYRYRFCFSSLSDAIDAFGAADNVFFVPESGWVASRPENRLLLPRDLINFVSKEKQDDVYLNDTLPIDDRIEQGWYTKNAFHRWAGKWRIQKLDVGVTAFMEKLPTE